MNTATFADRFAGANVETRTAFVADLWEALGWETNVDGRVVTAERTTPVTESRKLLVPDTHRITSDDGGVEIADHDPDATDIDAVVAPADAAMTDPEVDRIDATDLAERARYGVDRADARTVFSHHFGRPLASRASAAGGSGPDAGGADSPSGAADHSPDVDGVPSGAGPGDPATDTSASDPPETRRPDSAGAADSEGLLSRRRARWTLAATALLLVGVGLAMSTGTGLLDPFSGDTASGDLAPGNEAATNTTTPSGTEAPVGIVAAGVAESSTTGEENSSRYATIEPTCDRPPGVVLAIQVEALGRNDELPDDAGIRTAYRFYSPPNRYAVSTLDEFTRAIKGRLPILLDHESVAYGPPNLSTDGEAPTYTRRVTFTDRSGTMEAFLWSVTRNDDGCWLTTSITADSTR